MPTSLLASLTGIGRMPPSVLLSRFGCGVTRALVDGIQTSQVRAKTRAVACPESSDWLPTEVPASADPDGSTATYPFACPDPVGSTATDPFGFARGSGEANAPVFIDPDPSGIGKHLGWRRSGPEVYDWQ